MRANLPDLGQLSGTRSNRRISTQLSALSRAHNASLAQWRLTTRQLLAALVIPRSPEQQVSLKPIAALLQHGDRAEELG